MTTTPDTRRDVDVLYEYANLCALAASYGLTVRASRTQIIARDARNQVVIQEATIAEAMTRLQYDIDNNYLERP